MKNVMCVLIAVIAVFVYGLAIAGQGSAPVTVVNTNSNPVPMTGDVEITVMPNVTVGNTNSNPVPVTGNLGISETVDVDVVNSYSNPVHVREIGAATLTPFQGHAHVTVEGVHFTADSETVTPGAGPGKRIVAEFVSAICWANTDNLKTVTIQARKNFESGYSTRTFYLLPVPQQNHNWIVSQGIRLYSDEELKVGASRWDTSDEVECEFSVSGYVVDVATP